MIERYPDEDAMWGAFQVEPEQAVPEDGFWLYRFGDSQGVTLWFSFNTHEGSVQTRMSLAGCDLMTVLQERAEYLAIVDGDEGPRLWGGFAGKEAHTALIIRVFPKVSVEWSTLAV